MLSVERPTQPTTTTRRRKRRNSTIMIIKPTRWVPPPLHPHQHFSSTALHQFNETDFKPTFYNPNEVKHRRRISSDQCGILESEYLINTKPNATKRHQLAERLGMTPRTVQIWFQNKRAKAKQQQIKSDNASLPQPPAQSPLFTFDDGKLDPVYLNNEISLFGSCTMEDHGILSSSSASSSSSSPLLSDMPEVQPPYDESMSSSPSLDFYLPQAHDNDVYDPAFIWNWMQKTPTDPDLAASVIPSWPYMMIDPYTAQDDYINFAWDQGGWMDLHE